MYSNLTKHRKNIAVLALLIAIVMVSLSGRLAYLMIFRSGHYRTGYSDRKNAGNTGLNLCSINSKKKDLLTLTKMNVTKFVTFERKGLLI